MPSLALPARLPPLGVLIAGALVVWFSVPTLLSLHNIYSIDADYSHGHLVLLLSAILAVRETRRAPMAPIAPSWVGSACLLVLALVVLVGHASTTLIVAQAAVPALWMAAVWALTGAPNARRLAWPLSYAYFAIPIWSVLIEPMRHLTVSVVSMWIRAAGMPAFIEGNLIHVPSGTFAVEGGCAGLRYMLIAAALAVFSLHLNPRRFASAALLVLSALGLALVGNWLRVFTTVAAGLAPEGAVLQWVHNYHTPFGWVLFVVFMAPLFYLDRKLQSESQMTATVRTTVDAGTAAMRKATAVYVVCAALAAAIVLTYRIDAYDADELPATAALSAPEIAGWDRVGEWQDARRPVFVGAGTESAAWYVNGTTRIGAYIAHYPSQDQAHEVVFAHNRPVGQSLETIVVARRAAAAATASGSTIPFQELEVADSAAERRLVWVGFRVAGEPVVSDFAAKALQVYGVMRGRRDAQALVLTADCDHDCTEARSRLSQYALAAAELLYEQAERPTGVQQAPHDTGRGVQR